MLESCIKGGHWDRRTRLHVMVDAAVCRRSSYNVGLKADSQNSTRPPTNLTWFPCPVLVHNPH